MELNLQYGHISDPDAETTSSIKFADFILLIGGYLRPNSRPLVSRLRSLVGPWTLGPFLLNCLVSHPPGHSVNGWYHVTHC